MPNLRGASPVGRDVGDFPYATRSISRGTLSEYRQELQGDPVDGRTGDLTTR